MYVLQEQPAPSKEPMSAETTTEQQEPSASNPSNPSNAIANGSGTKANKQAAKRQLLDAVMGPGSQDNALLMKKVFERLAA